MERFDTHVGSGDAPLEETPEILKAIGMDAPVDILDGVIHNLVRVVAGEPTVGEKRIGVERGTRFHMLANLILQHAFLPVGDDNGANLAAALKQSHNGGFVFAASTSDATGLDAQVHIAGLTADESLVGFHFAITITAQLHKGAGLHGIADAVEHEPCGLLSDAQSAGHFAGTNSVLCAGDDPDGGQPFLKTDGRILHYGSDLSGELPLGMGTLALPFLLVRQPSYIVPATGGADDHAIEPAVSDHVCKAVIGVGKVNDGIAKGLRGFHVSRIGGLS